MHQKEFCEKEIVPYSKPNMGLLCTTIQVFKKDNRVLPADSLVQKKIKHWTAKICIN